MEKEKKIKDTKKEYITFSNGVKPLTEYISYPFYSIPLLVVVNRIREWEQKKEKLNDQEKGEMFIHEGSNDGKAEVVEKSWC